MRHLGKVAATQIVYQHQRPTSFAEMLTEKNDRNVTVDREIFFKMVQTLILLDREFAEAAHAMNDNLFKQRMNEILSSIKKQNQLADIMKD